MFQYTICAFLAPSLASAAAAAFPWALPEPTFVIPAADNWSPAPTLAPGLGAVELFRRATGDNTCGYISARQASSLTCNNSNFVCATNSANGVHGCCDPATISSCSILTTCIPSSLMSASCTDAACTSNGYIAKCTESTAPSCYEWRYVYSTQTVMTEHGCAATGFTISVQRTFSDGTTTSSIPSDVVVSSVSSSSNTVASSASSVPASTTTSNTATAQSATASSSATAAGSSSSTQEKNKVNIGAIVGGVVGGIAVVGALAFAVVFLLLRNRKAKQNAANAATGVNQPMMGGNHQGPAPGVGEYKPQPPGAYGGASPAQQYPPTSGQQQYGAPGQSYGTPAASAYYAQQENKAWPQQHGVPGQEMHQSQHHQFSPPGSPAPQYPGSSATQPVPFGAVEAGGTAVPGHPSQAHPQPHPVYEAP